MKQLSEEQQWVMDAAYKAADDTVEYVSKKQRLYAAGEALLEREELAKEDLAAKITKLEGYIEELQANRLNAAYVIETLRKENAELRELKEAWRTTVGDGTDKLTHANLKSLLEEYCSELREAKQELEALERIHRGHVEGTLCEKIEAENATLALSNEGWRQQFESMAERKDKENAELRATVDRLKAPVSDESVAVPRAILQRICGMVYATRRVQNRMNYVTDQEYVKLVNLQHSGKDAVETVMTALIAARAKEPQ